ncbi:MAG TPA: hypothetical protein EYN89_06025 [Flavobacteriales bacterium]|nr:hypothetical protein [Flavobacteriales bacterium]
MIKPSNIILVLLLFGIYSCKKDSPTELDMGYNYYPNNVGSRIIYDVDSIIRDDFFEPIAIDTSVYQIKEVNESVYLDSEGRETMRIERYKRSNSTMPWVIKDIWYANRTASMVERTEENIKYRKLVFPVRNDLSWNGNAANIAEEWNCQYSDVNMPMTLGGIDFDSTLIVNQKDENLGNTYDYFQEGYAAGIGLVYKIGIHWEDTLINNTREQWEASSTKWGYHLHMTINSSGN